MKRPLAHVYRIAADMGRPEMTSMADTADTSDGRVQAVALEQIAYELRTANLIAYLHDNGALDPRFGQIMGQIVVRLGFDPADGSEGR